MVKKLDAGLYDTDKKNMEYYLHNYEEYFAPLLAHDIRLLELGIYRGGSLLLWRDYFARGLIVGLDMSPISLDDPTGRIRTYQGLQHDTALLDRIRHETAPEGFDVVIDDCSHRGAETKISFWHLFDNHLKAGGLYVIEDWSTGYWESWPDGAKYQKPKTKSPVNVGTVGQAHSRPTDSQFYCHNYGLVGFIHELVDECGMADITREDLGTPPYRPSKFQKMHISRGQVIIIKAPLPT
jgi:hypothetical protein